ncbi:hypothetical protein SBRCBS47491_002150 [Sporothrix bragantina]|uniref:Zn(2)-C6 fungal-type domain-containing protein n=1 Tax=Sporothrix bragantina TaxID=671064 RepID=A0ABP0B547_9PEZI
MRSSNTCDGCALRRVRCDANRPCSECQKRSLPCTTFRVKKKRGPKGPRQTTTNKIRTFQRHLEENAEIKEETPASLSMGSIGSPDIGESQSPGLSSPQPCSQKTKPTLGPPPIYRRQPLAAYCRFLGVFRTRAYSVWPIVSCDALERRITENEDDYESWTLAASVCAGVIAQLRLPEHQKPLASPTSPKSPKSPTSPSSPSSPGSTAFPGPVSSHKFAADAEHFRTLYDYREQISVSSLLASFFLHIYYANDGRLRTAGLYLREALTQAHMLGLHRSDTYATLQEDDRNERELRLRVYWVLFVSERTYCVQHGLPPILRPIRERPAPDFFDHTDDNSGSAPIASLLDLTRLFTVLDGDLIEPPSASSLPPPCLAEDDDEHDRQMQTRRRVTLFQSQSDLLDTDTGPCATQQQNNNNNNNNTVGLNETQRVDIFVTRSWIRILLWEYSVRHFVMSSSTAPNNQAFSMLLPALVAHSMLGFVSTVSGEAIRAHGYGMELKVFRIADSLLDVLACSGHSTNTSMLFSSRDTLHGLERVLATVGGLSSVFLARLHSRMAEIQLPVVAAAPSPSPFSWTPALVWPANGERTDDNDMSATNVQDISDITDITEITEITDMTDLPGLLQMSPLEPPPETCVGGLVDFVVDMDMSVLDDSLLQI